MELARATDALLGALRQTDEYRRFEAARRAVEASADDSAILRRYLRAQTAVQLAAISGATPKAEDAAAFESLSALAYASEATTEYLLAQMGVQQLVAKTMERVTREVGLTIELPEC